jgi:hypothetical protein
MIKYPEETPPRTLSPEEKAFIEKEPPMNTITDQQSREAFEKWAFTHGLHLQTNGKGGYQGISASDAWEAWQAALKILPATTPNASLPPLVPEGPRREMLIRISVSADFEKRLDNQWEVEREIAADRWSWEWADESSKSRLKGLRQALGFVENDSQTDIHLWIDDATKMFHAKVGKRELFAPSFDQLIDAIKGTAD